ncbi:MAG: ThiF family adenylyltransferase [Succinivibrionaceae bacterium]|nr:ThiF family adenylyltransferase [Succinivibrionaceae bacterium]
MKAEVYISGTLRMFTSRECSVEVEGQSVGDALKQVVARHADIENVLFDNGRIRGFVRIFLNDAEIRTLKGLDTPLGDGDTVYLIPAVAGGSGPLISNERAKEQSLSDKELDRFSGHLMLKEIGVRGQKRLKAAKVLVAGCGPIGSEVATILAGAGVGSIGLWDCQLVELGDLKTFNGFSERDIRRPRTACVRDRIRGISREIHVDVHGDEFEADDALDIVSQYDLVVDCTDTFRARYLVNDACHFAQVPQVFAAVYQAEGRVSVFAHARDRSCACFRCLFPEPPESSLVPTCSQSGIFSGLPSMMAGYAAVEALKLIVGAGATLENRLLVADPLNLVTRVFRAEHSDACRLCGADPEIATLAAFDYDEFCHLKISENEEPIESITVEELLARIENNEPMTLVDVREPHEQAIHRFRQSVAIPIGQLARRKKELDPTVDTIFLCKEGKRSVLAINTLREAGYSGPMFNLKGGMDAAKDVVFSNEAGWL